uniref:Uncharacterized protein n=1 Tax=viral metagenome TaxID=1070528 RepID=A0A6C0KXM7_9ZZZZ|tara:strand:- start:13261 stop:15156 length:1896 start_codon:yes stop_codon:yes gene_type:complete
MSNNFNERIFDDITFDILKSINQNKKTDKMNLNDFENIVNDMLNDEVMLKKYTRDNIVKYTSMMKDEINKNEFDANYFKSRTEKIKDQNKMKLLINEQVTKRTSVFSNINYGLLIKNISSSFLNISRDLVLFFFTICIVAHLRIRSFIKSCYLYPSNPNRFPYVFFNSEIKEQDKILSITHNQNESDTDPVFENMRMFRNRDGTPLRERNMRINNMCADEEDKSGSGNSSLLEAAVKILFREDPADETTNKPYLGTIEKIVQQLTGSTHSEKLKKINMSAKAFMEEHSEKCKDDLSVYSLITYLLYYSTFKNRDSIGYLHTNLFKYLTSSGSKLKFGIIVILLFSIFKNNVNIAERFVNNVLDYYSDKYDGSGNLHTFFVGILSSVLAPFVTFSLLLMIIVYPLSIFNCMKSYFNYVGLTNQFSTKAVCYVGIVYSIFALVIYGGGILLAIFPELLNYMIKELKFMTGANSKPEKKTKGKGRSENKKGKSKKEGFKGEKGCSSKGFFNNFNIAKLFGTILMSILGLIVFLPVVMPFVCAFISSFGISSSLTFDSLNFMANKMCSVKEYSSMIKLLVGLIIIHQMIKRYSYGATRNKWITIGVYGFFLVVYMIIENVAKPTNKYFDNLKCDN